MIDVKELRIGNRLYRDGNIDTVTGIFHEMWGPGEVWVIQAKNYLDYRIDNFEPIPLTPEILEKCGFERDEELCGGGINDLIITYGDANISLMQDNKGEWMVSGMYMNHNHFLYLHQLQNLYYALTGQELTITP